MRLSLLSRLVKGPLIVPALGLSAAAYFAFHAAQGDHGWVAQQRLTAEIAEVEAELGALRDEREVLAARVAGLTPSSLDPDLAEERVRAMLGVVHPDEVVILLRYDGQAR